MPAGQCRKCSYPLDEDEAVKRACPACGALLRDLAPFQPGARPQPLAATPPRRSLLWPLVGMGLLAAASFGAGVYVMRPSDGRQESSPDNAQAAAPTEGPHEPVKSPPTSRDKKPDPAKPPEKVEEPKKDPKLEQPKKDPPPVVKPPAPPLPEVLIGDDRRLDRPNGDYSIGALVRGGTLKLSGKVKTLRVVMIDGQSTIDASALEAQEIIFTGRIGGGSTVKLRAPGGKVEFKGKVDGESRLEVDAPGGTVTFSEPTQLRREGSKIAGDSTVTITAKVADFRGAIDGVRTRVVVTLTKGGLLSFKDLSGSVRLQYRKAEPGDPYPRVFGGPINGTSRLEKID